jgi:hypothetical protein
MLGADVAIEFLVEKLLASYVHSLRMTPLRQKADSNLEMMKAIVGTNEYNHVLGHLARTGKVKKRPNYG